MSCHVTVTQETKLMLKLEAKHYLFLLGVALVMSLLASMERPLVTKAVSKVVNDLF